MLKKESESEEPAKQWKVKGLIKNKRKGRDKIVGDVEYHRDFYSANLKNERDILIWLPPSYSNHLEKRYPVLYMHDGQNIIDPETSFTDDDWRVDETATRLIKDNIIEEFIIIGINNTPDRLEEYSDSEKGKCYIKFIIEELKPYIDKTYRTLNDRANTAVMGSSMGGLISFLIAWNHPEIFSKAACLSTSFHYNNKKILNMIKGYKGETKNIKIYMDHGEDGLEENQLMFAELTSKGYRLGRDLDYFYARGAQHSESAWAERLERPLIFLFGK